MYIILLEGQVNKRVLLHGNDKSTSLVLFQVKPRKLLTQDARILFYYKFTSKFLEINPNLSSVSAKRRRQEHYEHPDDLHHILAAA